VGIVNGKGLRESSFEGNGDATTPRALRIASLYEDRASWREKEVAGDMGNEIIGSRGRRSEGHGCRTSHLGWEWNVEGRVSGRHIPIRDSELDHRVSIIGCPIEVRFI